MTGLLPLDLHAHIDVGIDQRELDELHAVVFAVTRSLAEAKQALERADRTTVWGVGCHPGLSSAHGEFSRHEFAALLDRTAFAGELGLDGKARVPLDRQRATLRSALKVLAEQPRLVSLHSYGSCEAVLDEVERAQTQGVVLHWWLGTEQLTRRAIELGYYFSINSSCVRRTELLSLTPLDRILTETDHPFGDRRGSAPRRPGAVEDVERALARAHGLSSNEVRLQIWRNLDRLVREVRCSPLLPRSVRARLAALV